MDSKEKIYDFVVIGSGMGGLTSSVLLAMEGHSVLVLEKNHQIGGSLQAFSRDKCIFDTGVHYIGSLDNGENLNQIFKYIGILDDLPLHRLDDDKFDQLRFPNGLSYDVGHGYANFKAGLYKDFPDEVEAIDAFCDKIIQVCSYFPLYNLEVDSVENYMSNPELLELDAWGYVSSITDNDLLKAVLLGSGPLYAGEKGVTPFYVVALIMNSFINGSYRLKNGGGTLSKALAKRLRSLNGVILKHQKVVGAEYDGAEVVAVVTEDGTKHYGKKFISNMHPKQTIELFGEDHFRSVYRKRIGNLANTASAFTLYLSLKKDTFPYINYNVYDYFVEGKDIWNIVDYDKEPVSNLKWPQAMFTCTPVRKKQSEYAESISVMVYMSYEEVEQWGDTFNTVAIKGERGEAYEAFKKEKEEAVICRLEERFPMIRDCIKGVYSSTPITYKDYIGTSDGSMYGIRKNVENILVSQINTRTKIPNLYLTGQNIIFHGILGASIGALVTCFNFIDQADLVERIRNAK